MSIANIEARLESLFAQVAGTKRVYPYPPETPPASADCPCIILDHGEPFIVATVSFVGTVRYTLSYKAMLLLKEIGQDRRSDINEELYKFVKRFIERLAADLLLGNSGTLTAFNDENTPMAFNMDVVQYQDRMYWGFEFQFDVQDDIDTTFTATTT